VAAHPSVRLKLSGHIATIEPDPYQDGAFILDVDGTPQSHVFPDHPDELFFEYVRRIGHVIDSLAPDGEPITAVHLGGGGLTLPRYVAATRPGSRQQVIELEQDLIDFVREHLPLQRDANIRIRYGDARDVLGRLPSGLLGSVDLVVIDIYAGARTPAHVTSLEFFQEVARLLSPTGVIVINAADGPGLAFVRSEAATLRTAVPHVIALAEAQVLKGRRFGNVVLVGGTRTDLIDWMPRLMAGGPHPARVLADSEMKSFIGNAPIVTDATAVDSPTPNKTIFQMAKR
jgi:SAM-dependent methyltransferase